MLNQTHRAPPRYKIPGFFSILLERRFLSRCKVLEFSSYGLAGEIANYLDRVWHAEGGNGNAPDLARLAKDSRNNVRDCLMRLEVELMAA